MINEKYFKDIEVFNCPNPDLIGLCAGSIWNYLNENKKSSIIKLKLEIQYPATLLYLGLGWLLREDKIEFKKERGEISVYLK